MICTAIAAGIAASSEPSVPHGEGHFRFVHYFNAACGRRNGLYRHQGETTEAVLWRRCAFHSGEISAKDNEILYFLILKKAGRAVPSDFLV
jgi:hypothetical protein